MWGANMGKRRVIIMTRQVSRPTMWGANGGESDPRLNLDEGFEADYVGREPVAEGFENCALGRVSRPTMRAANALPMRAKAAPWCRFSLQPPPSPRQPSRSA